jgi:hypothetical protein
MCRWQQRGVSIVARRQGSRIRETARKELDKKVHRRYTEAADGFQQKQIRDTKRWMNEQAKR